MNDEESIFPYIEFEEEDDEEEDELEELCEYAYDFENNCLLKNESGQNYFVYRNDALILLDIIILPIQKNLVMRMKQS